MSSKLSSNTSKRDRSKRPSKVMGALKKMVLTASIMTSLSGCYGYNENLRSLDSNEPQKVCVDPQEFIGMAAIRIDGEPLIVSDKLPLDGEIYSVSYSDEGYLVIDSPDSSTSTVIPYRGSGTLNGHTIKWVDFSTDLKAYISRALISIDEVDYIVDELERVEFYGYTLELTSVNVWDKAGRMADVVIRGPDGEILHPLKLTPGFPHTVRNHTIILKDVSVDMYPNSRVNACNPVLVSAILKVDDDYLVVVDEETPQELFDYTIHLDKGFVGTAEDVSYDATDYASIIVTDNEVGSDKEYVIKNGDIIYLKDSNGETHEVKLVNVVSKAKNRQ